MLRINPVLRASYRLLSRSRAGFCITNGYLNPARHITMNHNPHNVYIDAYDIGQYPEVVEIMSQPPRTYEPVVAKTLVEVINKKYPEAKLTEELLYQNTHRDFNEYIVRLSKDKKALFGAVLPEVLLLLSQRIIVKESRWTWLVEQQRRLQATMSWLSGFEYITVKQFLDNYNQITELLVNYSQLGHSKDIIQPPSPLENHYLYEMNNFAVGVADLSESRPQNQNLVNRLMAFVHKI